MNRIMLFILLFILIGIQARTTPYRALTITPVVHCTGESLPSLKSKNHAITSWHTIPFCGKKGTYACPRIHQILFNTPVTIIEEQGDNVKIKITSSFYETKDQKKCNLYWTEKKAFIPLSTIKKAHHTLLPSDFDFTSPQNTKREKPIICLIEPFPSKKAHCTFSAGTRFVLKKSTQAHYLVYCFNPTTANMTTLSIPRSHGIEVEKILSCHKQRQCFVKLLKRWASESNGFIPYVWGGCSYIQRDSKPFCEVSKRSVHYYDRPKLNKCGFDCAGLITRAAQTCGIPFFFKNTTTIKNNLKPIEQTRNIQDGDIMWIQGHVMVVSNKKENTLIEARSYGDGYGKVHELPLRKVFKNITTYDQLMSHIKQKKPLERFDNTGKVKKVFGEALILSLKSALS